MTRNSFLVLIRYVGQSINIGSDIKITVLSVANRGTQVKIGISAPEDIKILREELEPIK